MSMDRSKYARLNMLLAQLNKQAYKIDYVVEVTEGRAMSSKELTDEEFSKLIGVLENELKGQKRKVFVPGDKQRKKIISCCREMQWVKEGKADMERINAWVEKYGYLKKPLMQYKPDELPKLVLQAENMRDSFLKGI